MFELKDLEKWRTLYEMKTFWDSVNQFINSDKKLKSRARLKDKQSPFKELLEEYLPLMHFAELHYKGQNVECRYVGQKTQNCLDKYDGEIRKADNTIDKIEIVAPRDGKLEHLHAVQLNQRGITDFEVGDTSDQYKVIENIILTSAKKKAGKNYFDVILVVYFEFLIYFHPDDNAEIAYINNIVNELRRLDYTAKEVYFLIPSFESSTKIFEGKIYNIK